MFAFQTRVTLINLSNLKMPATLPDGATAASWPLQRSSNARGRCNCWTLPEAAPQRARTLQELLLEPQHAPATLQDAATAALGATARICNAPGRCDCAAIVASGATGCSCSSQALQLLLLWDYRKLQQH